MKNIIILAIALLMANVVQAQARLILSLDQDAGVYTVQLVPEVNWQNPMNAVGAAQVVIRVQSDQLFTPVINSGIAGLVWADNAYVEEQTAAPGYTFVCISLVNGPTNAIPFVKNEPVTLFTFTNAGGECPGPLSLLPNADPMVQAVRNAGYNITQYVGAVGARGNAVTAVDEQVADCSALSGTHMPANTGISQVQLTPVPASHVVKINWNRTNQTDASNYQLVVYDARGREMYRSKIQGGPGLHSEEINVEQWNSGLYSVRFLLGDGFMTQSWNMMVVH